MIEDLPNVLKTLDEAHLLTEVKKLNEQGVAGLDILKGLQEGMRLVGEEYEAGTFYLPELIMSGIIFQQAVDLIKESLASSLDEAKYGTFVIGTVKDDIHDIGKNIAATLLACRGFNVVDLGVDVPIETYLKAIKEHKPRVVGLSCLLGTSFDSLKATIDAIEKEGLRSNLAILIGGAVVDESICKFAGADAFCINANDGVKIAQILTGVDK